MGARALLAPLLLALVAGAGPARAGDVRLETVLPSLPGQNNVDWWAFDWKWTEFSPVEGGAPVRLHFYEEERGVAEVAQPLIAAAYADLVRDFGYTPSQRIPFLLYNSHFEFESTRAFLVSEGVLGITSTQDLTMALPYWGDHQRFRHVMRHELAHVFTIQKVVDAAHEEGCNPLEALPLWFIEGLAERFSQPGLTAEVRAAMADRITDGKPEQLPAFFEQGLQTFERVYLLGHARVRFLDESFGEGTVRRILEESGRLCGDYGALFGGGGSGGGVGGFASLVARVTRTRTRALEERWQAWARAQVEPTLAARHPPASLELLDGLGSGEVDSFSLAPDGRTLFYRTVDFDTGVARLYLRDLADARSRVQVAKDQRVGLESLHPVDRRVSAVGADLLAWVGRSGAADVLFVRRWRRVESQGRVRFELGASARHDLSDFEGLIEGGWPAVSAQGAVAFVGLSRRTGHLDVYQLDEPLRAGAQPRPLTRDAYAEQGLAFGPDGALYLASDATPEGRWALFRLEPPQAPVPLVALGVGSGALHPAPGPAGLVFQSDASGLEQAWRLEDGVPERLSDVPTALLAPTVDAGGHLLGIMRVDGRQRLVRLAPQGWLGEPLVAAGGAALLPGEAAQGGAGAPAWEVPRASLEGVRDYRPLARSNLDLVRLGVALSTGPFLLGEAAFADRLKTRIFGASAEVLGSFERTNATAFYLEESGRLALGGALFARSGIQLEGDVRDLERTFTVQRFGGLVQARYPFDRFVRLEGFASPQLLRGSDFSDPHSQLARTHGRLVPAFQVGVELAVDTLRLGPVGPYEGASFSLSTDGTLPLGAPAPFARVMGELQGFRSLVGGYERLLVRARLAGGSSVGGALREDFYLPAALNLRALREGSLALLGNHYYLGQLELHFPLLPDLGGIYVQGLAGVDAGAIVVRARDVLGARQAAAVLGLGVVVGPLALRFDFARPLDIGAGVRSDGWIPHFSLSSPFGLLR